MRRCQLLYYEYIKLKSFLKKIIKNINDKLLDTCDRAYTNKKNLYFMGMTYGDRGQLRQSAANDTEVTEPHRRTARMRD